MRFSIRAEGLASCLDCKFCTCDDAKCRFCGGGVTGVWISQSDPQRILHGVCPCGTPKPWKQGNRENIQKQRNKAIQETKDKKHRVAIFISLSFDDPFPEDSFFWRHVICNLLRIHNTISKSTLKLLDIHFQEVWGTYMFLPGKQHGICGWDAGGLCGYLTGHHLCFWRVLCDEARFGLRIFPCSVGILAVSTPKWPFLQADSEKLRFKWKLENSTKKSPHPLHPFELLPYMDCPRSLQVHQI